MSSPSCEQPHNKLLRLAAFVTMALLLPTVASAHGVDEEDFSRFIGGGPALYFQLGAEHMLTGYDHLLFLFGVIFYLKGFKDILKYVSIFTLGHSITLLAATVGQIQANPWLVDAVVAFTVCYKAFDNLDGFSKYIGIKSPDLVAVIFVIGLIHGFGLSTRLQQLPLGNQGLVLRILSFNAGVEAGQVIALLILGMLLAAWRRTASFAKFGHVANAALLIAGGLLFLFQLHGYVHVVHADDFPINEHAHEHLHEEMAE